MDNCLDWRSRNEHKRLAKVRYLSRITQTLKRTTMPVTPSLEVDPALAHAESQPPPSETTDLERRVLAHERILQSLIAYMARTEPRFIDHLRERFVEPMRMATHEHDHRETDDYAEEFIRAVMRLGDERARCEEAASAWQEHCEAGKQWRQR